MRDNKLLSIIKGIYTVFVCIMLALLLFLMVRKLWYEAHPLSNRIYPEVSINYFQEVGK